MKNDYVEVMVNLGDVLKNQGYDSTKQPSGANGPFDFGPRFGRGAQQPGHDLREATAARRDGKPAIGVPCSLSLAMPTSSATSAHCCTTKTAWMRPRRAIGEPWNSSPRWPRRRQPGAPCWSDLESCTRRPHAAAGLGTRSGSSRRARHPRHDLAAVRLFDDALAAYERASALAPGDPEYRFLRSTIWLMRGDFARGWPEFEARLQTKYARPAYPQPRWNGASLQGERDRRPCRVGAGRHVAVGSVCPTDSSARAATWCSK